MRSVFQVALALPIVVIMQMMLPADLNWYQLLSLGIVSSMISGTWLKYLDA